MDEYYTTTISIQSNNKLDANNLIASLHGELSKTNIHGIEIKSTWYEGSLL